MPLLKMCRFFTIITCTVITVGSLGDSEIVNVKRGEAFSLSIRTSEPKMVSLHKVQNNDTQEIFLYCSPEEQNHGCKPSNSSRISHHISKENFSITFLDASTSDDEGHYMIEVIEHKNTVIKCNYFVSLTEQLPRSINPEPPSIHPFSTPALSTKSEETFGTNGPISTVSTERNRKITWGIKGGLLVLIVAIVVTGIICCNKKKQYVIVDDGPEDPGKGTSLNSDTNGAGELATVESFKILVQSVRSVDNNNEPVQGA